MATQTESDVLAKYSTPGLRQNTLSRNAKAEHLRSMGLPKSEIEKTLAVLYPENKDLNTQENTYGTIATSSSTPSP